MPKISKPPTSNGDTYLYPDVSVRICKGKDALTISEAKELLGWESETDTIKFGEDFLLQDVEKRKVRCLNNTKNRPLNIEWCQTLAQDILNGNWKMNLETIIIGRSGQVLSGQHRLVALVLAHQTWAAKSCPPKWKSRWKDGPFMETLVAFGANEDDAHTQTLDNVRPRTLADTLYTSTLFKTWKPYDKKTVVRVTDQCVRLLWDRTGMSEDQYSSKMTNTEAYEFLSRHLKVLEAVKHVYTENNKGSIQQAIPMGHASGLMYLMAASSDSRDLYAEKSPPEESVLSFEEWSAAARFWIAFGISRQFSDVRRILMLKDENDGRLQAIAKIGVVIKAWQFWTSSSSSTADVIPADAVAVEHAEDAKGNKTVKEFPTLGGIDVFDGGELTEEGVPF